MSGRPRVVAGVSLLVGLAWTTLGASLSWPALLLSVIPGSVLVAAGGSESLWPGDVRPHQFAAAAALLGCALSVLGLPFLGVEAAGFFFAASLVLYLLTGWSALGRMGEIVGVPRARPGLLLWARAAFDEVLMASLHLRFSFPEDPTHIARLGDDLDQVLGLGSESAWEAAPASYHQLPGPPEQPELRPAKTLGREYEHLQFDSGFRLRAGEPARPGFRSADADPEGERAAASANDRAHAWVLRHEEAERPWIIAINGYRMGQASRDLSVFPPRLYHQQLGLNMAIFVLPLHGPRTLGRLSGDGFMDGDPLVVRYAQAQAVWDLRRLIAWIRGLGGDRIGVMGISLGGYTAALLAGLESLDFVIAGTPATDLERLHRHHGPPALLRHLEAVGLTAERVERVLRPVAPLSLPLRVPHEARFIYAGVADGVVPPDQFRDLCAHWEQPRMVWLNGGHIAWGGEITRGIRDTLREAKILL